MQDLVDIAANEFGNKAKVAAIENMADAGVDRSGFVTDEEPDRLLETSLILPFQLSLEVTAFTNTSESILKHSNDMNRTANQAYMHVHMPTYTDKAILASPHSAIYHTPV